MKQTTRWQSFCEKNNQNPLRNIERIWHRNVFKNKFLFQKIIERIFIFYTSKSERKVNFTRQICWRLNCFCGGVNNIAPIALIVVWPMGMNKCIHVSFILTCDNIYGDEQTDPSICHCTVFCRNEIYSFQRFYAWSLAMQMCDMLYDILYTWTIYSIHSFHLLLF